MSDGRALVLFAHGARDAQWVEIAEGLSEGAQVIVQGNYALPDGTKVAAEEGKGEQAASETGIQAADAGASEEKGK